MLSETSRGLMAMVATCVIWGLSSIYYKLLSHVPPLEVLAHRTLWSLVFFGCVLALQGRLNLVRDILRSPRMLGLVALSGLLISVNWFFFIWSVQAGRALEASLGYYIFPLVAVAMGAAVLGERLSPVKWSAVALVALAVAGLTWGLGVAPIVSLVLAFSFGCYGLVKRWVSAGPVVSVTTEVMLLAPLALIWLYGAHALGWGGQGAASGAFGRNWSDTALLMLSGPLTGGPLILFSYAGKRVTYATIGLVQYLNPTIQAVVATFIFLEPFSPWHGMAFGVIWVALALYSAETLRNDRAARRARVAAGTPPAGP
ncbi:EamA family transporter RarD [Roseicitreum antarcticum]|uniref:Chloramphenicol-sensitive protein RarD n=1 Tax=Roseicitreum antarcticum TaxID=564137 RepID=A0A1H3BVC8_9RHOB|nr:EamA family transporter RarD [Roseicitreum antarcticum]SDX45751.1 chloramphenicol-sensitive protein RarD [Roseicitreum antarcticum]